MWCMATFTLYVSHQPISTNKHRNCLKVFSSFDEMSISKVVWFQEEGCGNQEKKTIADIQTQSSAFSLGFFQTLHNQAWFPPNRKTSLFPPCLRLSAILCGPGLSSARGQKYPPMAPLTGTGHIDHRRTALKIQSSSATAPLVHSLALSGLRT